MQDISLRILMMISVSACLSCGDKAGEMNSFEQQRTFHSRLSVAPENRAFYKGLKDNDIDLFITYSLGLYPRLIDSNRVEEGRLIYTEELGGGIRDREHYEYDSLNRLVAVSANRDISTYRQDITYTYGKDSFTELIVSEVYENDTLLLESLILQDSLISEVNIMNQSNIKLRLKTYSYNSSGSLKSLIQHSQKSDTAYIVSFEYYDTSNLKTSCLVYLDDFNKGERVYTYYSQTQLIDSIVTVSCNEREVVYYAYNNDAINQYNWFLGK
jgi:hypothetical protein